jgi:hypothetical protein
VATALKFLVKFVNAARVHRDVKINRFMKMQTGLEEKKKKGLWSAIKK